MCVRCRESVRTFCRNVSQQLDGGSDWQKAGLLKGYRRQWPHGVKAVKREGLLYFKHKRAAYRILGLLSWVGDSKKCGNCEQWGTMSPWSTIYCHLQSKELNIFTGFSVHFHLITQRGAWDNRGGMWHWCDIYLLPWKGAGAFEEPENGRGFWWPSALRHPQEVKIGFCLSHTLIWLKFSLMTINWGTPKPIATSCTTMTSACSQTDPRSPQSCILPLCLLICKGFFAFYLKMMAQNPNIGRWHFAACSI